MTAGPSSLKPPKVGHKKSRNGCKRCKARRVKCDEVKPICSNCRKHGAQCDYGLLAALTPSTITPTASRASSSPTPSRFPSVTEQSSSLSFSDRDVPMDQFHPTHTVHDPLALAQAVQDPPISLPESRERRLLEIRLIHNWVLRGKNPFPLPRNQGQHQAWQHDAPRLMLENDNLQYAVMSYSATSLLRQNPYDEQLLQARENYLVMALAAQREAVTHMTVETTDATVFASLLVMITSFAMLHERTLEGPYTPPISWMAMGRGAGSVIELGLDSGVLSEDRSRSNIIDIIQSQPRLWEDDTIKSPENRAKFLPVLSANIPSEDDMNDPETKEAYENPLSYIGAMQKALMHGEPVQALCKRLQCFTMWIPSRYIDYCKEQRPRALVVLAYFFAVCAQFENPIWWVGDAPEKEIIAISKALPDVWRGVMIWPVEMAQRARMLKSSTTNAAVPPAAASPDAFTTHLF